MATARITIEIDYDDRSIAPEAARPAVEALAQWVEKSLSDGLVTCIEPEPTPPFAVQALRVHTVLPNGPLPQDLTGEAISALLTNGLRAKNDAERAYHNLCAALVARFGEEAPEGVSDSKWDLATMVAEEPVHERKPRTFLHVLFKDGLPLQKPLLSRAMPGDFVAVRPCGEDGQGKTYLGIMLGDLVMSPSIRYHEASQSLLVGFRGLGNPAMWVPDLDRVVMGCESWWNKIDSPEDLRAITNNDIQNVWYVRALAGLTGPRGNEGKGGEGGNEPFS